MAAVEVRERHVVDFSDVSSKLPAGVLSTEYIAALTYAAPGMPVGSIQRGRRRLPPQIDTLERSVRFDVYEQMMLDGQIKACVGLLIAGIVGGGIDFLPATEVGEPSYNGDVRVAADATEDFLEHMESPLLSEVLPDMLKSVAVGNRIAEKVYFPLDQSPRPGRWVIRKLKPKHRRQACFVVDYYMNVLGIASTPYGMIAGPDGYEVLPREKFAVLTWQPTDSDPRGTSSLRSVYEPYWRKQRYRPAHIRYLDQFASPSIVGELAEANSLRQQIDPATGQPAIDKVTGKPVYIDRSAEMLRSLEAFQNSSLMVIPNGAKVHVIEVQGDGRAFLMALDGDNTEIAKGILFATLATEQAPNQGRAAASVHQDIVSVNVDYGIGIVENMIRNDLLRQWVDLNYPPGTRVPKVRLPGANRADFLAWASAISKLSLAQYLDPSQYPGVDAKLGLPRRSAEGLRETIESTSQQRQLAGQSPPADPAKTSRQVDKGDQTNTD